MSRGFKLLEEGYTDLACIHPETGERWVIEAKGHSTGVGLDFNTCLGPLLKRMHDQESAKFGLAILAIDQYRKQISGIGSRVRRALHLHWILVAEDGVVSIISPEEPLASP